MSGKRSRGALRAFLAQEEEAPPPDPRAAALRGLAAEEAEGLEAIRSVFAGTGLPDDPARLRQMLRIRAEIRKEWGDARDSFLAIGRALLALEQSLTRAEMQRLRQGTERIFPFSDATATQLRQIARAVESGRLPQQDCPGSYGTAYQITLLSDGQLRLARERGLIRPDVTRREILELRRATPQSAPRPAGADLAALREEQRRLAQRRDRLAEALEAVETRLRQIEEQLARRA